jgi:quercetin dioxygenase-like cupin family protein
MTFVKHEDVREEQFDWGTIGWRLTPQRGSRQLVVMDVTLAPGGGHDFHRHPDQEELILVNAGRVTQYVDHDTTQLGPGDSVFVPANTVHASFNEGDEPARLTVVLGPSLGGDTGYALEDVSDQEPWSSLRT